MEIQKNEYLEEWKFGILKIQRNANSKNRNLETWNFAKMELWKNANFEK